MRLARSLLASMGTAGAIASAVLLAGPAIAQDSPLSLADRVARLEQQAQHNDQGGVGLVNQISQLQSQLSQQEGEIEDLQHQVQVLSDKNKAQYLDLNTRLARLEKNAPAPAPSGSAAAPAAMNPKPVAAPAASAPASAASASTPAKAAPALASPAEKSAYEAAFQALRGGNYADASRGFRDFLQKYPNSQLSPNACYWLGESYYATANYPVALEAFQQLLKLYPQSDKSPDALLKVGYTQIELKQPDAAKATLKQVVDKYPGTKAAALAQERLRRLQADTPAAAG